MDPEPNTNQQKPTDQETPNTTETTNPSQSTPPTKPTENPPPPTKEKPEAEDKKLADMKISEVLKVNCQNIDFGEVMPGQIIEETVIILNNMNKTKVPFKVKVNCLSEEFEDLDEYVYSMRRPTPNEVFNYNDTFLIILAQKAISYYKLAIKVPNVKEEVKILGNIEIVSDETKESRIEVPISASVVLPKIKCEKMMRIKSLNMSVIKLFMKNPVRQDFRISLKNCASQVVFVEFSIVKNERTAGSLDFNFYPAQISLQPFAPNNFVMSIKVNRGEGEILDREIKFILIAKVRNSSAIFSYPAFLTIGGV